MPNLQFFGKIENISIFLRKRKIDRKFTIFLSFSLIDRQKFFDIAIYFLYKKIGNFYLAILTKFPVYLSLVFQYNILFKITNISKNILTVFFKIKLVNLLFYCYIVIVI